MPDVTQTRGLPGEVVRATFREGSKTPRVSNSVFRHPDGTQTTTSYRSGRNYSQYDEYEGLSGEDLAHHVGREYRTRFDNGHEFSTEKSSTVIAGRLHSLLQVDSTGTTWELDGEVDMTSLGVNWYPSPTYPTTSKINSEGARAIKQTLPTAPELKLAQVLGELREGLPSLIGASLFRKGLDTSVLGDEYLNYNFAVMPTANDIKSVVKGIKDFHANVLRVKKQSSDLTIRKAYQLSSEARTEDVANSGFAWGTATFNNFDYTPYFYTGGGTQRVTDTIRSDMYFKGAYTHHLAEGHSFLGKMERYNQLADATLGSSLTPEVIWQLTPWSWLIDWFYDVDGFVRNLTALSGDSLVLRYGYVMSHNSVTRERRVINPTPYSGFGFGPAKSLVDSFATFATTEKKTRTRSTPYGFGVDLGALSPQRVAILGALGLSKAPNLLRHIIA